MPFRANGRWFVAVSETETACFFRSHLLDITAPKLKLQKLADRLALAFSQTMPALTTVAFKFSQDQDDWRGSDRSTEELRRVLQGTAPTADGSLRIIVIDDIYGDEGNGSIARDAKGGKRLQTDGAGLISLNLARQVPWCSAGRPIEVDGDTSLYGAPLAIQVRLWFFGWVAKGMLVVDSTLPDGLIVLPDSQVKVGAKAECRAAATGLQAFEVICTSNPPPPSSKFGKTTPQLVPLLEHAGRGADGSNAMTDELLKLEQQHIARVKQLKESGLSGRQKATLLRQLALPSQCTTAADLLISGFDPVHEPWLEHEISQLLETALKRIAEGRVEIPFSGVFLGVPDWTGTLREGVISVLEGGKSCQEDVLIYRSPGIHPGDVRKVQNCSLCVHGFSPQKLRLLLAAHAPSQCARLLTMC